MTLKVGLIQLTSRDDIAMNLATCERLARLAHAKGAKFILFPENFSFLGVEDQKVHQANGIATTTENFLKALSRDLKVWVLGGGYATPSPQAHAVYNQSALVNQQGQIVAQYQKIHLFDVDLPQVSLHESKTVARGSDVVVTTVDDWNVGLSICYDVRFPELYRAQRGLGAQILTVPSAFTKPTGLAHWHTLLRARAIENQCYVLAPAQTGSHVANRASFGHSLIVDPWGEVLADAGEAEGFVVVDLNLNRVEDVRRSMPVWQHKRL